MPLFISLPNTPNRMAGTNVFKKAKRDMETLEEIRIKGLPSAEDVILAIGSREIGG